MDGVFDWLDRISGLRVVVTGDSILDVYTTCEALGKASKEPVLCLNRGPSVTHGGGILA
ncbi:MAG TPA: cytidyltransferase, partial [Actinobacteria bacterium]|nr:cytidyltransferase [Actinomycetota bacterium]